LPQDLNNIYMGHINTKIENFKKRIGIAEKAMKQEGISGVVM